MSEKNRLIDTDINEFLHEWVLLSEAGMETNDMLEVLQNGQENRAMRRFVSRVCQVVKNGETLTDALSQHPAFFPAFQLDVLRQSKPADLIPTLKTLLAYRESIAFAEINLKARLRNALIYPALLFIAVLAISLFLMIFVVPVFDEMFQSFGAALPQLTAGVLAFSGFLLQYGPIIALILIALIFYYVFDVKRQGVFSRFIHWALLATPGFGRMTQYMETITALRTWVFMQEQQQSLAQSTKAAVEASNNPFYAHLLAQVNKQVEQGSSLPQAISEVGRYFPAKLQHILMIVEKTQKQVLLSTLADFYMQKLNLMIKPASQIFNLFMILILWLIVGTLVIAMYLPIFHVGTVL